MAGMNIRDRVKELRRVKASSLIPNPKNWRIHPQSQRAALKGILAEIGYADALLVRETPAGLIILDGHLRASETLDQEVPVLIVDLTDEEADKLLAVLDPLAAMAERDDKALAELLASVKTEDEAVRGLLESMKGIDFPIPEDNKPIDEAAMTCTENECPKCGFKW